MEKCGWPIAFQDTIGLLLFGQVEATVDRADDQIQAAEHVIRQIERTICENIHSMPLHQSKAQRPLFSRSISALCADNRVASRPWPSSAGENDR